MNDIERRKHVSGALALGGDVGALSDYYRHWAADYDADVTGESYRAPRLISDWLRFLLPVYAPAVDRPRKILDAGCGSGLLGHALRGSFAGIPITLDGTDLSPDMIALARATKAYDQLAGGVDLTQPAPSLFAGPYDVIVSAGVFTQGHVPPQALDHLAAVAAPGALIVISVRDGYRDHHDLAGVLARAADNGIYRQIGHLSDAPYVGQDKAEYIALQRL